jgi:hypothetical protein
MCEICVAVQHGAACGQGRQAAHPRAQCVTSCDQCVTSCDQCVRLLWLCVTQVCVRQGDVGGGEGGGQSHKAAHCVTPLLDTVCVSVCV